MIVDNRNLEDMWPNYRPDFEISVMSMCNVNIFRLDINASSCCTNVMNFNSLTLSQHTLRMYFGFKNVYLTMTNKAATMACGVLQEHI